ncbi:dihydropteroate synthase [Candidatus Aerophobetes bacterium]|nr:dihydropteroate synthase [Candidatus Aerophobetes bacterium]
MQGFVLSFSHRKIDLTKKVAIMGILNLTPDSFYDGGRYKTEKEVLEKVEEMINEGADIIDVGGESTRPGAEPVSVEEELRRTVPFIQKITEKFKIPLSIDTYKAKVAKEACEAGAEMVNDISGLRFDPGMPEVVSSKKSYLVIMHIKGTPQNMQDNPTYKALIPEIISYLKEGIEIARRAGIGFDKIIVDPGIGFGKRLEHNLSILKNLKKLTSLKRPILVGVSRKSFIGQILNLPVEKRLTGSIAAACVAVLGGARIIRCHDVKQTRQAVDVVNAIMQEKVSL